MRLPNIAPLRFWLAGNEYSKTSDYDDLSLRREQFSKTPNVFKSNRYI